MSNEIVTQNGAASGLVVVDAAPVSTKQIQQQINAIQQAMKECMQEGTHFGKIPGCGDKPGLFKAGAEKLCLMFRLRPEFELTQVDLPNGHREIKVMCTLRGPNGEAIGQGLGSCSTMESKYRYRSGERKCPHCEKPTIRKNKEGGYYCWGKIGGCGKQFPEGDKAIEGQQVGKVENPDIADQYNTVLKMAKKRAHVDATITCTAASDIFTQDIEDIGVPEYPTTPKAKALVVPAEELPPAKPYYYSTAMLPEHKKEDARAYLDQQGAFYDEDLKVWQSPKRIAKMDKYLVQVEKEASENE